MPKRSNADKIKRYKRKLRKLEERSNKQHSRVLVYSSSSESEKNHDGTNQSEHIVSNVPKLPDIPDNTVQDTNDIVELQPDQTVDEISNDLDPELLMALGDASEEPSVYGEKIHDSLAQRWTFILKKGLDKDTKEYILKNYQIPENCKLLKAPTLNPEIKAAVAETIVTRDKNIQRKQDQLGLGLTAINKAMTLLLQGDDKVQSIKILSDSCRILADIHFTETQVRSKLITPCLDKSFTPLIKEHERDGMLFGEKLSETIKAAKAIEKQGLQIKKSAPKPTVSSVATPRPTTARTRFSGNGTGLPRYQSGNRGGRGGQYRTGPYYRHQTPATATATTSTRSRSYHNQNQNRAYSRR